MAASALTEKLTAAGVTLALQNHRPIIKDHHDVLRMVREVGSPHLKVCLDVPLMSDKSPAFSPASRVSTRNRPVTRGKW